jgi:MFS family permease
VGGLAVGVALAPSAPPRTRSPGPPLLAGPALFTLGGAYFVYRIRMGAMWVLLPAFAAHAGAAGQTGRLVALWSVGSLVGGLALAARPPRGSRRKSYLWLLGTLAATSLLLALPTTVGAMGVAVTVFGVALAPWLAINDQLVAESAAERTAELSGWLTTAGQIGSAAGSILAGPLGDRYRAVRPFCW